MLSDVSGVGWTELDGIEMCKEEYSVIIDVDIISDENSINIIK